MMHFLEEHKSIIIVLVIVLVLAFVRSSFSGAVVERNEEETTLPLEVTPEIIETFFIEVLGSVNYPGVYEVTDNLLVIDAINLAGSYSDNADVVYAEMTIPLSRKVQSEMKIYIPALSKPKLNEGIYIHINTASKEALMALDGVGEVTADKIIDLRPFYSWEELKSKTGIRNDILQELQTNGYL